MKKILFFAVLAGGFASCTVVRPHQVAVKSKLGKIDNKVRMAGPVAYNPFITKVIKVNVRTMNLSIKENLPSKEGLTILSESSILYHIKAEDVCSRYYAKDMHSAKRNEIEQEIRKRLAEVCEEKGFVIEAVLLKSISLPQGLTRSIEAKANKAANDMLNSSLTPNVLKMNQIQAFMKLSISPNTKTIITDGKGGVINMLDDK